jgi:hypothetical protein
MTVRKMPLGRLVTFMLLSLLDLLLTRLLIQQGEGQVYESNPIANWWLTRAGWLGLSAFKLGSVLLVAGLSVIIACYRPRVGRLVLSFACATLLVVVLYSSSLATCLEVRPNPLEQADLRAIEADKQLLNDEQQRILAYHRLRNQLAGDLLTGRRTLAEAAELLRATERGQNPRWLKFLSARYAGLTAEECVAANLVEFTLRWDQNPCPAAAASQLQDAFFSAYGTPWPAVPEPACRGGTGNQPLGLPW